MKQKLYEAFEYWEPVNWRSYYHMFRKEPDRFEVLFAIASEISYPNDGLVVVHDRTENVYRYMYAASWWDPRERWTGIATPKVLTELLEKKIKAAKNTKSRSVLAWRQDIIKEFIDEFTELTKAEQVSG